MASTQRHMAADRLRCERGYEWAARSKFSPNQLARYATRARQGNATPERSGISCKDHPPPPTHELKCEGPCDRRRDLRFFSKNTRKKGTNWCMDCTDYQLCLEVGASLPPPNSQRSVEETAFTLSPYPARPSNDTFIDPDLIDEATFSGDDATSNFSSTPSQSQQHSTTFNASTENPTTPTVNDDILDKYFPPHLRGPEPTIAPHWFLPPMDGPLTGTSGSSTIPVDGTSSGSNGVPFGVPLQAPGAQAVSFNAWGPSGEYARMVKTPTVASSSAYAATENQEPVRLTRTGWAKPPTRKYAPRLPDYLKDDYPVPAYEDDLSGDLEDEM